MMRALNIGLRTTHIASMGVLLGGHVFVAAPERLTLALWLTVGTGLALMAVESGLRLLWFHQGRGFMTMAKLALLVLIPFFWDLRFPILLAVVALASVGSHMSGRFRYYSVVYRRVIHDGYGPGWRKAQEEEAKTEDAGVGNAGT